MNIAPFEDKIPLAVGISGHRNPHPEEIEPLKQKIGEIFDFLQKSYPQWIPVPTFVGRVPARE